MICPCPSNKSLQKSCMTLLDDYQSTRVLGIADVVRLTLPPSHNITGSNWLIIIGIANPPTSTNNPAGMHYNTKKNGISSFLHYSLFLIQIISEFMVLKIPWKPIHSDLGKIFLWPLGDEIWKPGRFWSTAKHRGSNTKCPSGASGAQLWHSVSSNMAMQNPEKMGLSRRSIVFVGVPQARWMVYFMENPNIKWMMNRGTPWGNPKWIHCRVWLPDSKPPNLQT